MHKENQCSTRLNWLILSYFFSRKLLDSHSRNNVRVILKMPTKSWNPVNESYDATYWDSGSAGPVFVKNAQFLNYIPFLRH